MSLQFFKRDIAAADNLFAGHFVDARILYVRTFRRIPNVIYIGEMDVSKAYGLIRTTFEREIRKVYQSNHFNHKEQEIFFNTTLLVLKDRRLIEVGGEYVILLYDNDHFAQAKRLAADLSVFRIRQQETVIGFARQSSS